MAQFTVANGDQLSPIWVMEKVIGQFAERDNLWAKLIGEGPDAAIQKITKLEKSAGDTVRFTIFGKNLNEPVVGDGVLEGNEASLNKYHDTVVIDQARQADRLAGLMTEQRSAVDLRSQIAVDLKTWANDYLFELLNFNIYGTRGIRTGHILPLTWTGHAGNALVPPSSTRLLIGPGRANAAGLAASDKMTTAILDILSAKVKLLINSGQPLKPCNVPGMGTGYPVVLTSEQVNDLWQDSNFVTSIQRAADRGEDKNNMFTGALGKWKNLILLENPAGPLLAAGGPDGYTVPAARAILLGGQAMGLAFGGPKGATDGGGGRWKYTEKQFDYENQTGYAIAAILGAKKFQFNNIDFGTYCVDTAYTAI